MPNSAKPSKQRTNVSVDGELLEQARVLGVNVSAALEEKLRELVTAERRRRWLEENKEAIEDANAFVGRHGVFSDGLRRF